MAEHSKTYLIIDPDTCPFFEGEFMRCNITEVEKCGGSIDINDKWWPINCPFRKVDEIAVLPIKKI